MRSDVKHFQCRIEDRIATVRLNRPDRKNPLTFDSYAELRDWLRDLVYADDVDVVMMSPRAMGVTVREAYEAGKGVPGFVAVAQDVSGQAREIALALAKAIGCTRAGVFECSFADESDINLLGEQGLWPLLQQAILLTYEVAVEAGIPPEVALIEYYASGEAAEIFRQMALEGIFKQA